MNLNKKIKNYCKAIHSCSLNEIHIHKLPDEKGYFIYIYDNTYYENNIRYIED